MDMLSGRRAGFLLTRRDSTVLRIRGIILSICAVGFLHCYWISVQLGYMTGPLMRAMPEYWIMSTWLPFGIALFHASNTRFLHVARGQRRFVVSEKVDDQHKKGKTLVARFRRMGHTRKVLLWWELECCSRWVRPSGAFQSLDKVG